MILQNYKSERLFQIKDKNVLLLGIKYFNS